ncbi:MAG: Shedu anti-phage system protein SduA domain-containing protein [Pseudomonadota bacterium]
MPLPPDTPYEEVLIRLKEARESSHIRQIAEVTLRHGPQTYKTASLMEVMNKRTGETHHHVLILEQFKHTSRIGWQYESSHKITLDDRDGQQIHDLFALLNAHYAGELQGNVGNVRVLSADSYAKYEAVLQSIPDLESTEKLDLIRLLLGHIESANRDQIQALFADTSGETLQHIAAASRMVEYSSACSEMTNLIDDPNTKERELQAHLDANPWMFGSEYSELLSRRNWTRDEQLDYMLRRTVDDYLEIVEIKTAAPDPLFRFDRSHKSYYPSRRLSQVIGQVMKYIEEVERNRNNILVSDEVDTLKIRVRVIVGRDGATKEERAALRNFNSHLHRIEVITYDQLLKIAERVLSMFREGTFDDAEAEGVDDDIPF